MNLSEQYNCARCDLYNAERRLEKKYTPEAALLLEQLKAKIARLYAAMRASGPSVRDIQADDGVLL